MDINDTWVSVFEIIGTVAIAVSGAVQAIRRRMDIFGVAILGLVASVGGGVIRDIIIGSYPPRVFVYPRCAIIAVTAALLTFVLTWVIHKRRVDEAKIERLLEAPMFFGDTLGLAAYTVLGIQVTAKVMPGASFYLLLFVGVVTGVGGGVLRDTLACTVPAIFRKRIYALASIGGAIVNILCQPLLGDSLSMVAGFSVIVILRVLAAVFRWDLPVIDGGNADEETEEKQKAGK